jgi:hypothetical protein
VISISPDHVFAYYGLSEIMRIRNEPEMREKYIQKAIELVEKSDFDWRYYLEKLGVELRSCLN